MALELAIAEAGIILSFMLEKPRLPSVIIVRNMNIKGYSAEGSERGLSGRFLSLSLYDHINRNKKREA